MNISIVNETVNDLIISIPNIPDNVIILSGMKKDIFYDEDLVIFSVEKQDVEFSKIQKVFSYVAGIIIGALLCLVYYSQIESLKDSIKFPVIFFMSKINCKENVIIKLRDTSTMELCSAEINSTFLESKVLISEQVLKDERKEYYESNITMFVVPFAIIFVLSIMAVVYFKTIEVLTIAMVVNMLLYTPLLIIIIKNHIFYKKVYCEINNGNGTDNTGDGTVIDKK